MKVKRLKLILVVPLILIIVTAAFLLLQKEPLSPNTDVLTPINLDSLTNTSKPVTSSECPLESGIEYYYYTKPNDPRNNKFGMYIYAEVDKFFELARKLVNSNGGDWGYVLIPYNVKDYDRDKWSGVFQNLREKHLIPIIQLHDVTPDDYKDQTKDSAEFLNSFVWPIKQRYISVYNEPNDAKFWGGKVDAAEYARILSYTVNTYKNINEDFFMINGAFNVSAGTTSTTMDSFDYMFDMNDAEPGVFDKLDGWASHSYPQPNFSGNPSDSGRWSIRAYQDELKFLQQTLGVHKDLPVFITETGWAHAEGGGYNASYVSVKQAAENMKKAYENYWLKDDRVRAVTPFTIWYEEPFDHFAWVRKDFVPYETYEVIKTLRKVAGNPEKLEQGTIASISCK